jgi:hypothetical protein
MVQSECRSRSHTEGGAECHSPLEVVAELRLLLGIVDRLRRADAVSSITLGTLAPFLALPWFI